MRFLGMGTARGAAVLSADCHTEGAEDLRLKLRFKKGGPKVHGLRARGLELKSVKMESKTREVTNGGSLASLGTNFVKSTFDGWNR
jgi:hypothetical protein